MNGKKDTARAFTGRHMLLVMLAFFGVIITVNVTMATLANTSWTGVVVQNSYVASQGFNERLREARRREALGWSADLAIIDGAVDFVLRDAEGAVIPTRSVELIFRRPSHEGEDSAVALAANGDGSHAGQHVLRDGVWAVEYAVALGEGGIWRDARRIVVRNGTLR